MFEAASLVVTAIGVVMAAVYIVAHLALSGTAPLRNEFSRYIIANELAKGVLFGLVVWVRIADTGPVVRALFVVAYLGLVVSSYWPPRLLWLARRDARERRRGARNGS